MRGYRTEGTRKPKISELRHYVYRTRLNVRFIRALQPSRTRPNENPCVSSVSERSTGKIPSRDRFRDDEQSRWEGRRTVARTVLSYVDSNGDAKISLPYSYHTRSFGNAERENGFSTFRVQAKRLENSNGTAGLRRKNTLTLPRK